MNITRVTLESNHIAPFIKRYSKLANLSSESEEDGLVTLEYEECKEKVGYSPYQFVVVSMVTGLVTLYKDED